MTTERDEPPAPLLEALATIEHDRWAHWQRYVHGLCTRTARGDLLIPAESVERWERQIAMPYADLPEYEKEADRIEVRRYWPTIARYFGGSGPSS